MNAKAEIFLENLKHNLKTLKALQSQDAFFCPMVKANAYGHGSIPVAQCLVDQGVNALGVSSLAEGRELRAAGLDQVQILTFGPLAPVEVQEALALRLTPVLSSWESLKVLESQLGMGEALSIHIKFNTGMNRLGFPLEEALELSQYLTGQRSLQLEGLCTHLATAELGWGPEGESTLQLDRFASICQHFDLPSEKLHVFNSAGLIAKDLMFSSPWGGRPGIALYGLKPQFEDLSAPQLAKWKGLDLRPVMRLSAPLCHTLKVRAGERVSYGGAWVSPKDSLVGIIPYGYADGYFRQFSNQGSMMFREHRVPVVGRVTMDYTMLDLTDVPHSGNLVGEEVLIFGEDPGAADLAEQVGTIGYEVLTSVGSRVVRVFYD